MQWLDETLVAVSSSLLVLALAGCSDDGLAPAATDAAPPATTSGQDGSDGNGPGDPTDAAMTTGNSGSGPTDDSTGGPGTTGPGDGDSGTETGSGTGEPPTTTCEMPNECVLINDCCQCAAAHVDDEIPECRIDCRQPMCDALGIPGIGVVCAEGTCELEPRNCSPALVTCDAPTPLCPDGTLPEVTADGSCWTGACIPEDACDGVPSCESCDEDETCVEVATQIAPVYQCRAVPEACGGAPTCDCMPPDTCTAPFDTCSDAAGSITCSCPAC